MWELGTGRGVGLKFDPSFSRPTEEVKVETERKG